MIRPPVFGAVHHVSFSIDELEPRNYETQSYRPKRPLYMWPLAAFALLVFAYHAIAGLIHSLRSEAHA